MEKVQLGRTGLWVSRLCFGALAVGPLQRNLPVDEGARVIRHALDRGINFVDTAQLYQCYPYIRKAVAGRDDVIIASRSYDYTYGGMRQAVEEARRELDRDVIDIFMLHEQESALTLKGHRPALDYLVEAKGRGIIRAIGVSTHHVACVEAICDYPEIEVVSPLLNKAGLGIIGGREAMERAIAKAHALGKGVYLMKALGGGHLIGDVRSAFAYALAFPHTHAVAVGMSSIGEVEVNLALFSGEAVDDATLQGLVRHKTLHVESWCQRCGLCVERCPAGALSLGAEGLRIEHQKCLLCGYCGAACPEFALKII
ncbi:MAG TPA: 4Fe-4S binding protein [Firmicutes bacterium]|nr:4Fe-4S binding protein [Bacillota bacterium]